MVIFAGEGGKEEGSFTSENDTWIYHISEIYLFPFFSLFYHFADDKKWEELKPTNPPQARLGVKGCTISSMKGNAIVVALEALRLMREWTPQKWFNDTWLLTISY